MSRGAKIFLTVVCSLQVIFVILSIPVWRGDAEARKNRARVDELVSVGQDINEAATILRKAGFRLYHEEPIAPTISKDYLQHIVIVREGGPNAFETFGYAADLPWMPFTHSEHHFVLLNANLDGTITEIE